MIFSLGTMLERLDALVMRTTKRPRLHPNDFIQLDLTENGTERLHIWPATSLPAQKTRHPIHDHAFDMESTVLFGALTNVLYQFVPQMERMFAPGHHPAYEMFRAVQIEGSDTVLKSTGECGRLNELSRHEMKAGCTYSLKSGVLHDSVPNGFTATLMTKQNTYSNYRPLVAVPYGVHPDNDFRRETVDAKLLWSFVERALHPATYAAA